MNKCIVQTLRLPSEPLSIVLFLYVTPKTQQYINAQFHQLLRSQKLVLLAFFPDFCLFPITNSTKGKPSFGVPLKPEFRLPLYWHFFDVAI